MSSYLSDCINNCDEKTNGELSFYNSVKDNIEVVFDVGCRSDTIFSNFKGIVHYFDPVEAFIEKLKRIPNNNKESYYNSFGLSDKDETLWYYPLFQSFHDRVVSCCTSDDMNKVSLRVRDAKSYIVEHNVEKIDLLKIDTEGHELKVLQGFGDLLKRVKIVQFEYGGTYIDTQVRLVDVVNHLTSHGFQDFAYLRHNQLKPLQDCDDHYQYCNIVCFNKHMN